MSTGRTASRRTVVWAKDDPAGTELAEIELEPGRVRAAGVAIGSAPVPYRLDYELETADGYAEPHLRVRTRGDGWRRTLELRRGRDGLWTLDAGEDGTVDLPAPGGDVAKLGTATDCDLALSPVTNLIPVLRHDLRSGGSVELVAAWVSVPDLAVRADGQRYTFVRAEGEVRVIRYEATDGTFAADITVDGDGIAVDYPGIARLVAG